MLIKITNYSGWLVHRQPALFMQKEQAMYKNFLAVDQYGNKHFVDHPRKELTALHGVKHANKIYRNVGGNEYHIGYKVAGHWYEVMRLSPLDKNWK